MPLNVYISFECETNSIRLGYYAPSSTSSEMPVAETFKNCRVGQVKF